MPKLFIPCCAIICFSNTLNPLCNPASPTYPAIPPIIKFEVKSFASNVELPVKQSYTYSPPAITALINTCPERPIGEAATAPLIAPVTLPLNIPLATASKISPPFSIASTADETPPTTIPVALPTAAPAAMTPTAVPAVATAATTVTATIATAATTFQNPFQLQVPSGSMFITGLLLQ